MLKHLVCAICPRSCFLSFDSKTKTVKGNNCPRGEQFFKEEMNNPKRVVTTTIKIEGGTKERISVKTSSPINKNLVFDCINEIKKIKLKAPIKLGDTIIENILKTGVDIVATSEVKKCQQKFIEGLYFRFFVFDF